MLIENFNIKPFTSFGIEAYTKYFANFTSIDTLKILLADTTLKKESKFILGGGSNILFTQNYNGVILKNEIDFIELVTETANQVIVKVGAGTNWHRFVLHCIENNWAGIENLSLIPGCCGAAPIQNIGAYGVEVKDVITTVEVLDIQSGTTHIFTNIECAFGYRESIFKKAVKGLYIITAVTFQLQKNPVFNTSYGAIEAELEKMRVSTLSIKAISDAVIRIRSSKLPNPIILGNAGSFFKNPTIPEDTFLNLQKDFSTIVGYKNEHTHTVKLAAGWLIEQCGFKGYRDGDAGCHALQALVLVNYGTATGKQIFDLSEKIIVAVQNKFGVLMEREVNII
jgi:UDP-N-acetylmuramate dehydrogenase